MNGMVEKRGGNCMNTNVASNLLVKKFGEFGITKRKAEILLLKGEECGMTVKQRYNYVRYWLSRKFDTVEKFNIEDIMCMTGLSRKEVIERFSDGIDELSEGELDRYFDTNRL